VWVEGIARYLEQQGLGTLGQTIFWRKFPDTPDEIVVLTPYGGPTSDNKLGYDEVTFQVRVRGPRTGADGPPFNKLQAIYDELHGLSDVELPDGTWVVGIIGLQSSPQFLLHDENGRAHYVLNFQAEIRNQNKHRE